MSQSRPSGGAAGDEDAVAAGGVAADARRRSARQTSPARRRWRPGRRRSPAPASRRGASQAGGVVDDRADRVEAVGAGEQCAGRLPVAHRRPRPAGRRRRCTAGWTRRRRACPRSSTGSAANHEPAAKRTVAAPRPIPARLARATSTRVDVHVGQPHLGRDDRPVQRPARRPATGRSPRCPCRGRRSAADARVAGELDGQLDRHPGHLLGLRTGDQHAAVDHQVEVAEAPVPEHVLQRLAVVEADEHPVEVGDGALRRRRVELEQQLVSVEAAGGLAQPAGLRPVADAARPSRSTAPAT